MIRINLYKEMDGSLFNDVFAAANRHIDISGIKQIRDKMILLKQEYAQEVEALIQEISPKEDELYEKWLKDDKKFELGKKRSICIVSFTIMLILFQIITKIDNTLIALLYIGLFFAFLFMGLYTGVFYLKSQISDKRYCSFRREVFNYINNINNRYSANASSTCEQIDSIYLNSLDPAHREMVIIRREQQRQHEELMRIEKEKLLAQQAAHEEQKRARIAQEEILKIKREEQERYRRY